MKSNLTAVSNETLREALNIFTELSPENLTCDGELSRAEVDRRFRDLLRRLRKLTESDGITINDECFVYREWDRRRAAGLIPARTSPFAL